MTERELRRPRSGWWQHLLFSLFLLLIAALSAKPSGRVAEWAFFFGPRVGWGWGEDRSGGGYRDTLAD